MEGKLWKQSAFKHLLSSDTPGQVDDNAKFKLILATAVNVVYHPRLNLSRQGKGDFPEIASLPLHYIQGFGSPQ